MTGYMRTPLGDDYRVVFYHGKKWVRVRNNGFWGEPFGKGWTNIEHTRDRFDGIMVVLGL